MQLSYGFCVEVCAIFEDMVLFTSGISRIYEEPNIFVAY